MLYPEYAFSCIRPAFLRQLVIIDVRWVSGWNGEGIEMRVSPAPCGWLDRPGQLVWGLGKRSPQGQGSGQLRLPAGSRGSRGRSPPKLTNFCILITNFHAFCMTFIIENQFCGCFSKYGTKCVPGRAWPGRGTRHVKYGTIPGNTGLLVTLTDG